MALYPTEDSNGHCLDMAQVASLKEAIRILNRSEVIGCLEESANYHSAADFRQEMSDSLHIANIEEEWISEDDGEYEWATCTVCKGNVTR